MEILGMILVFIGAILWIIGGIWFLIATFCESILWGLGCLLVPFVGLIFLFAYWEVAGKPFGVSVLGVVVMVIGSLMAPGLVQ